MSEYQYYEFAAIDAPLTPQQMAELRARSSRASITPTRAIPILDLPMPDPPPEGAEWIDAYRRWYEN